jgi:hypothetical protein
VMGRRFLPRMSRLRLISRITVRERRDRHAQLRLTLVYRANGGSSGVVASEC